MAPRRSLLYRLLHKKTFSIYISLIAAMLIGRVVFGLAMALLMGINGGSYTMQLFLAGAFINAWPGIILHSDHPADRAGHRKGQINNTHQPENKSRRGDDSAAALVLGPDGQGLTLCMDRIIPCRRP